MNNLMVNRRDEDERVALLPNMLLKTMPTNNTKRKPMISEEKEIEGNTAREYYVHHRQTQTLILRFLIPIPLALSHSHTISKF